MRSGAGRLRWLPAGLRATLFPDSPEPRFKLGRGESAIVVISLLAIAIVLQILRLGWSVSLNSIWAEDGTTYFQTALTKGFGDAILTPYAEYLVLVPRLVAEVGTLVPLQDAPAAMAVTSAAIAAVSGLAVWFAAAGHIENPYLRGGLAVLTTLCPVAGLESINSGAYVPWFMLFPTFWLLIWRPRTWLGSALAALFILATALSSPGVWFFIPLAVLRTIAIRDGRDAIPVGSFWVGAIAQVPVVAANSEQGAEPTWTADIWTAYLQRIIDGGALGERLGGVAWSHLGWAFLTGLLLLALVGLVAGWRRSDSSGRSLAAVAIPTSIVMFFASAYQREVGTALMWPAGEWGGASSRYAIVPALLLVGAALALIDGALRRRPAPARLRPAVVAALIVMTVAIVTSFSTRDLDVRGTPEWDDALRDAAVTCEAEGLPGVPVSTSPPGFGVYVPCDKIPESLRLQAPR